MKLTTYVSAVNTDGTTEIKWKTGESNNGSITVRPMGIDNTAEQAIAGELIAINYLITDKKVLGETIMSGRGICLDVSKGAIKKIQRKACGRKNIVKYGSFLRNALHGVEIKVTKTMPELIAPTQTDDLGDVDPSGQNTVDTPALGLVKITEHALERYIERVVGTEAKNPRASLLKRIKSPDLTLVKLPEKIVSQKKQKYGNKDNSEIWSIPTSDLKLQLVKNEKGDRTLVTVFQRAA